jgi:Fe-S cluster assembly protein SufD
MSGLPTSELEDWRYVDCRALAAECSAAVTVLPGEACDVGAFPDAGDATHAWALAGNCRMLRLRGEHRLMLDDLGGAWALRLDLAPGAIVHLGIRRYASAGRSASWLNAVLGQGASLVIDDLPAGDADVQLAALSAVLAQDAQVAVHLAQSGGRLLRHRLDLDLSASGAGGTISAAASVRGDHQAHLLTRVVHRAATTSRQLAKAVLRDRARSSFDGVVSMLPGADGSVAEQQDRNLLLSPGARADTRPQLDIRADEVEASHGATIGALDADELVYLRARGLPESAARDLLTVAFLDEALLAFADPALRQQAQEVLHAV